VYWRELLFWLLLLPTFAAFGSGKPNREFIGLAETCGFLVVAVTSTGRLKDLGLEFIAWEQISRRALAVCAGCGLVAGGAVIAVARLFAQPLGIERGWNKVVLAVALGPILEEVIFRGYPFSLTLRLTRSVPYHLPFR